MLEEPRRTDHDWFGDGEDYPPVSRQSEIPRHAAWPDDLQDPEFFPVLEYVVWLLQGGDNGSKWRQEHLASLDPTERPEAIARGIELDRKKALRLLSTCVEPCEHCGLVAEPVGAKPARDTADWWDDPSEWLHCPRCANLRLQAPIRDWGSRDFVDVARLESEIGKA